MTYDIEAIRKKLKAQSGKFVDPDEFKPPKATSATESIKYRFFVLPPLKKGDKLKSGIVPKDMEHFFLPHGSHWISNKPYPCPKACYNSECKICNFGFNLLREEKDDTAKQKIRDIWLPSKYSMVNIYFTNWQGNPEELRRKVKFYNAPKTVVDQWTAALYRDDKGDPTEPDAFGVFFDEHAAFIYQLEIVKKGRNNNYEKSHFVTQDGIPVPMVGKPGQPDEKSIETLLKLRHNLFSKVDEPNLDDIDKMYLFLTQGDDSHQEGGDKKSGFDHDEMAPPSDTPIDESAAPDAPVADSESDELAAPDLDSEAPLVESSDSGGSDDSGADDDDISSLLDQLDD